MRREYIPNKRENDSIYLLRQAHELCKFAKANRDSSFLIYSCLECRLALEIMDLNKILASVNENERLQILEESKPKNGIDRLNKKTGSLKQKYQQFLQAMTETINLPNKSYNYTKSKDLQHQLSLYIHSYGFKEDEIRYDSTTMRAVFDLVNKVESFINDSLPRVGEHFLITGMEIATMPEEDKKLLDKWKKSEIDLEELKNLLKSNYSE